MGDSDRKRLDASSKFAATLHSQVPHPIFNDAEAEANSEFVERLDDNGVHTGLIVIAPHGGDIERHTSWLSGVASRLRAKAVSSSRCKGFKERGGASDRWHITSTDIHETIFRASTRSSLGASPMRSPFMGSTNLQPMSGT